MTTTTKRLSRLFTAGALVLLNACGGGGGDAPPPPGPGPAPSPAPVPTPPPGPAFTGFSFPLTTGAFWEYRWDYFSESRSSAGTSTERDTGRAWVVLGQPATIAGVPMYAVQVYGKTQPNGSGSRLFAPRWKYLGLNGGKLQGSMDGASVTTLFDANTGRWPGGGFFAYLSDSRLTVAQSSQIANQWMSGAAIRAGASTSISQCEYFPGIGTICGGGDVTQDLTVNDYFQPGIGPVGYYKKGSAVFSGGNFVSFHSFEENVGKTSSSFENGTLPFVAESSAAHAAPASAQQVVSGNVVRGDAMAGDPAMASSVTINGTAVPITLEDWYAVTVAGPAQLKLALSFEEAAGADLDVYVMTPNGRGFTILAMSVADNAASGNRNEGLTVSLPAAGTYYIVVDAFATTGGRAAYQLQVE
jgi:hypothetical protein